MENIFIAIVTDDKEYGRSLSLGMLNVCRGFIIRIFTAEEFLSADREYDLVLWDGDEVSRVYGGRIIYLAEKPSDVAKNITEKRFSVYKYSTAASFVAAVFEIYEALTGRHAVNLRKQDVRIFAFCSYAGGAGCTTVALSVAQELSRFQDKKVLYVSFEEFESSANYFRVDTNIKGVSVYLYELFSNMCKGTSFNDGGYTKLPFLEGRMVRDDYGVETFAPSPGRNPLKALMAGEVSRFVDALISSGRYEVIIMDIGADLSDVSFKCLQIAERICLVSDMHAKNFKDHREDRFTLQLMTVLGEDVLEKVVKASNKVRSIRTENIDISCIEDMVIDDGIYKIMLEGQFGSDINKLSERIMEP